MTVIGPGVEIINFDDNPPMKFEGRIDGGWWFVLLWYDNAWLFNVYLDGTKAWDPHNSLFTAGSEWRKGIRPRGRKELVEAVKGLVVKCSEQFRKEKGPRDWKPVKNAD